jgi:hypothetical protein
MEIPANITALVQKHNNLVDESNSLIDLLRQKISSFPTLNYQFTDKVVFGSYTIMPIGLFAISSMLSIFGRWHSLIFMSSLALMIVGFITTILVMIYLFYTYPQIQLERQNTDRMNLDREFTSRSRQLDLSIKQLSTELDKTLNNTK